MSSGRVIQPRGQMAYPNPGAMQTPVTGTQQQLGQQAMGQQPQMGMQTPGAQAMGVIGNLAAMIKRPVSSGGNWGFSYEQHNNNLAGEYGKLKDELVNDELVRREYLAYASELGAMAMQAIVRRNDRGGYYTAFNSGLELLRAGDPNMPGQVEPIRQKFFEEIQNNIAVYQHVLSNSIIQLVGDLVGMQMQGRGISQDGGDIRRLITECAGTSAWFMFVEYLYSHSQRASLVGTLTIRSRKQMENLHKLYALVKSRYENVDGAAIPWDGGRVLEVLKGPSMDNPLLSPGLWHSPETNLGVQTAMENQYSAGLSLLDHVQTSGAYQPAPTYGTPQPSGELDRFCENLLEESRRMREMEEIQRRQEMMTRPQPAFHDVDQRPLDPKDFTMENRGLYDLTNYFNEIPKTNWYIAPYEMAKNFIPHFRFHNTNRKCSIADLRGVGARTHTLYRFDMKNGIADIRYINIPDIMEGGELEMEYFTNPAKLLPYMWEEDGQVKSDWKPQSKDVSECLSDDNQIMPLSPMVALDKRPNMLFGNKSVNFTDDDTMIGRLESYGDAFDPKKTLDGFVLPVNMMGNLTMESGISLENIYGAFEGMIKGQSFTVFRGKTFDAVIREIRDMAGRFGRVRITHLFDTHLTNMINRWLIEERGYNELGMGHGALHLNSIFADLEPFLAALKKRDQPTMMSFLHGGDRQELLANMGILAPRSEAEAFFKKNVDEEDVVAVAAADVFCKSNVLLKSEAILIQMRKEIGSSEEHVIRIRESDDPKIFAMVREAQAVTRKHFKEDPKILLSYMTPQGGRIRSVRFSNFDESVMTLRALDKSHGLLLEVPVMLNETAEAINAHRNRTQ